VTVINRGATGTWHVFHGDDARRFLANIIVVASWPCRFKYRGTAQLRARLMGHDTGTFSLVFNNDNIPEGTMREMHITAVNGAKQELASKYAAI
jgi:hypothetical protein